MLLRAYGLDAAPPASRAARDPDSFPGCAPAVRHPPSGHEAVKAFLAELALQPRPGLLVSSRGGGRGGEEGLELRTAESYSQGLPSVGRAAQQGLLLPRKLIIFNPGRRKEGGEGEGLRKKRGLQRRGEERMGKGNGERGGERMRAEERAVEGRGGEGLAGGNGREGKERQGQSSGEASWQGSLGGEWMWRGHCHPPRPLPAPLQLFSLPPRALRGSPAGATPGCPSWPSHR